ncbi:CLUMA_CG008176, isoform A [Clunio marinus]|uniref:CLUMA_CG008176, isoform A n=1 Tax=Clunio marinus TaxID=568069 RepID=A0A1J1I507_9DIPT|nr:CLUMA_CG008176, isoform A [Clunio marinus]
MLNEERSVNEVEEISEARLKLQVVVANCFSKFPDHYVDHSHLVTNEVSIHDDQLKPGGDHKDIERKQLLALTAPRKLFNWITETCTSLHMKNAYGVQLLCMKYRFIVKQI